MVMKIAITGHKHGIGKAFAEQLSARGHEIIGISRSEGENIRRITHTTNLIEPCDLFINNAQSMFAQTELLYAVWEKWAKGEKKWIWNISTMLTQDPEDYKAGGLNAESLGQYRTQKVALEEASQQLRAKCKWPKISIIRPGTVATNDETNKGADVNVWVKSIIDTFTQSTGAFTFLKYLHFFLFLFSIVFRIRIIKGTK